MTTPSAYRHRREAAPDRRGEDEELCGHSRRARLADGDPPRRRRGAVHEVRAGLRLGDLSRRRQGLALPREAGRQLRVRRRNGQAGARRHAPRLADQRRDQRVLPRHAEPDAGAGSEARLPRLEVHQSRNGARGQRADRAVPLRAPDEYRLAPTARCPTTGRAKMVEVLVTGGAGFIGSNFVRYALRHIRTGVSPRSTS